jgi:protein TonB
MENRLGKTTVAGIALGALLFFALVGTGAANPPVSQDKPVKATGDVKPPKIVNMVEPVYPEDARKRGIEGTVILEATADIKGKVQGVKVLRGVDGLNQAALDAVKQWAYEPLMIDGKPKAVKFTVTIRFKLD